MLKMALPKANHDQLIRCFHSLASLDNAGRNRVKRASIFALTILVALVCAEQPASFAQRSSRRRAPAPAPTPVPDMRPEALRVAEQIKNVSRFIYAYSKAANTLEIAEDQAKREKVSAQVQANNKQSKDALVSTINGLRTGLDRVVKSFQTNPRLQVQYLKLSSAAEAAASAEQLATAGRYDEAGKALVTVIERLTDTLTTMRLL
jgi:hypothetical protein